MQQHGDEIFTYTGSILAVGIERKQEDYDKFRNVEDDWPDISASDLMSCVTLTAASHYADHPAIRNRGYEERKTICRGLYQKTFALLCSKLTKPSFEVIHSVWMLAHFAYEYGSYDDMSFTYDIAVRHAINLGLTLKSTYDSMSAVPRAYAKMMFFTLFGHEALVCAIRGTLPQLSPNESDLDVPSLLQGHGTNPIFEGEHFFYAMSDTAHILRYYLYNIYDPFQRGLPLSPSEVAQVESRLAEYQSIYAERFNFGNNDPTTSFPVNSLKCGSAGALIKSTNIADVFMSSVALTYIYVHQLILASPQSTKFDRAHSLSVVRHFSKRIIWLSVIVNPRVVYKLLSWQYVTTLILAGISLLANDDYSMDAHAEDACLPPARAELQRITVRDAIQCLETIANIWSFGQPFLEEMKVAADIVDRKRANPYQPISWLGFDENKVSGPKSILIAASLAQDRINLLLEGPKQSILAMQSQQLPASSVPARVGYVQSIGGGMSFEHQPRLDSMPIPTMAPPMPASTIAAVSTPSSNYLVKGPDATTFTGMYVGPSNSVISARQESHNSSDASPLSQHGMVMTSDYIQSNNSQSSITTMDGPGQYDVMGLLMAGLTNPGAQMLYQGGGEPYIQMMDQQVGQQIPQQMDPAFYGNTFDMSAQTTNVPQHLRSEFTEAKPKYDA